MAIIMIRFTSQHKTRSLEEPFLSQRSDLQAEGIRARYCIGTIAVDPILYRPHMYSSRKRLSISDSSNFICGMINYPTFVSIHVVFCIRFKL